MISFTMKCIKCEFKVNVVSGNPMVRKCPECGGEMKPMKGTLVENLYSLDYWTAEVGK